MSTPAPERALGNDVVRVAIMNDYEIVVQGLRRMLEPFASRVQVVELDSGVPVASPVDVLLYDAFSRERVVGPVAEVLATTAAPLVIYTWHLDPQLVQECLDLGVAGYVSKTLGADEVVEALEKIAAGSVVVSQAPEDAEAPISAGDWPGRGLGLSARESEVLALIAQGLSNQEVAARAYLSINSVKTYIRSAYRKIGVQRRSQAVLWAVRHGFNPDETRTVLDPPSAVVETR